MPVERHTRKNPKAQGVELSLDYPVGVDSIREHRAMVLLRAYMGQTDIRDRRIAAGNPVSFEEEDTLEVRLNRFV